MLKTTKLLRKALAEDHAYKDITSLGFESSLKGKALILAKQDGVVCGVEIAKRTFQLIDRTLRLSLHVRDGQEVVNGTTLMTIAGSVRSILAAERVALNMLQHLSGIATGTRMCVKVLNSDTISIRDTRKTLPLLRKLQKYAVRVGGGKSQRYNLADQVLFKDTHWVLIEKIQCTVKEYIERLKEKLAKEKKLKKDKPIIVQIEADTIEQVQQAITARPDLILLDNMSPEQVKIAVGMIRHAEKETGKSMKIEISGGLNVDTIVAYRDCNVDYMSIGALTHSVRAFDSSLKFVE